MSERQPSGDLSVSNNYSLSLCQSVCLSICLDVPEYNNTDLLVLADLEYTNFILMTFTVILTAGSYNH